jgi:hypothetical protein
LQPARRRRIVEVGFCSHAQTAFDTWAGLLAV